LTTAALRPKAPAVFWALGVLSILSLRAGPAAAIPDSAFTGYARDIGSGRLLYTEAHLVQDAGSASESRVVLYKCPRGDSAFARKRLTYTAMREDPQFAFEDARLGYIEGLRTVGGVREVYQRPDAAAPLRKRVVPQGVAVVSDAGFDEFVKKHWDELEQGKTVRFPFLVPSRLDYMTFKVKKHHETPIEGAPASVIRLNLSGLLGFFLPYIEVSYRKSDRVLMRYKGLVNIRDEAGDNLTAQIDFPARERGAATSDLAAVMNVPLLRRCP